MGLSPSFKIDLLVDNDLKENLPSARNSNFGDYSNLQLNEEKKVFKSDNCNLKEKNELSKITKNTFFKENNQFKNITIKENNVSEQDLRKKKHWYDYSAKLN